VQPKSISHHNQKTEAVSTGTLAKKKKYKNIPTFGGKVLDPNQRRKMQKYRWIPSFAMNLNLHTQLPLPPTLSPHLCSHPSTPVAASRRQCTKIKTAATTANAGTIVMAATVLGCCLCHCHLVVVVACHCPLPCYCPLCAIAIALATLAIDK
jgi:hypothetical protein